MWSSFLSLLVRIDLAWGELLLQNGDYFGPDVNLASRMVSSVPERVIALSNSLHRLLGPSERWENILLKNIKGLGDC
ncbi:MAG: adenylate/guanylate cyclase domain-containing protein [Candidatus Dormibacteria bacterium]